jgi:hypothetical protein
MHRLRSLAAHFTLTYQQADLALYNLDKTRGICGGLLPSFDLSGASRTTLVLDALCQDLKNNKPSANELWRGT